MNKAAYDHLRKCDPLLGRFIEEIGMIKHKPRRLSCFESLVRAITYQQLSNRAAETIFGRFRALFPNCNFPCAAEVLRLEVDVLRSAGLSRPKAAYIRDLASRMAGGTIPELAEAQALSDEELISRLTEIKGVGRWTVEMLLIFNLGRPDVLPIHDLSIRKGFKIVFNKRKLPEPSAIERYGERWRPYRTTASLYLWRACK
jgi:3-methyladenine DNA glycosylase/8-oxoguanine DNA glycosylase